MAIIRHTRADVDAAAVVAEMKAHPEPSDAAVEAMAAEDGDAWSDEDFAKAELVLPPPTPAEVKALRTRLGLVSLSSLGGSALACRPSGNTNMAAEVPRVRQPPCSG